MLTEQPIVTEFLCRYCELLSANVRHGHSVHSIADNQMHGTPRLYLGAGGRLLGQHNTCRDRSAPLLIHIHGYTQQHQLFTGVIHRYAYHVGHRGVFGSLAYPYGDGGACINFGISLRQLADNPTRRNIFIENLHNIRSKPMLPEQGNRPLLGKLGKVRHSRARRR